MARNALTLIALAVMTSPTLAASSHLAGRTGGGHHEVGAGSERVLRSHALFARRGHIRLERIPAGEQVRQSALNHYRSDAGAP